MLIELHPLRKGISQPARELDLLPLPMALQGDVGLLARGLALPAMPLLIRVEVVRCLNIYNRYLMSLINKEPIPSFLSCML